MSYRPLCPKCQQDDVFGHIINNVYDGVLYWSCPFCRYAWPRFTGHDALSLASLDFATEYNNVDND